MEALREEAGFRASVEAEKTNRILELEQQLRETANQSKSNKAAADILTNFIDKGQAKLEVDGSVSLLQQLGESNYVELEPELTL